MTVSSEPSTEPAAQPTAEQIAERARRADRATRGALAGMLGLEAFVVLLLPRTIAFTATGLGMTRTLLLVALAVLLVAVAAMTRRRWGIGAGSLCQIPFVLTGIWLVVMFFVAAIFVGLWLYLLKLRHELVGTPGGLRLLVS